MGRDLIRNNLKQRGLPFPPLRLGPEQEEVVREYKKNPTAGKRDYILAMAERFILQYYQDYNIPEEFDDYYQSCITRAIKALEDFDPAKGYFGRWIRVSLEGFTKTRRTNYKRDRKVFISSAFVQSEVDEDFVKAYESYVQLEQERDNDLDRGAIFDLLDSLVVRFCTVPELPICRFCVDYLKLRGRYPSLKLICETFCEKLSISTDDCYYALGYVRVACQLHFMQSGVSLARKERRGRT